MKMLALRKMNLLFALLTVAWAHQADARTYLDDCANNGVILKSQVSLGYLDTPGVPASATFSTFAPGAAVPGGFDHVTTNLGPVLIVNPTTFGSTATTPPVLVKTPPVGQPKDRVEVEAEAYFEFGTPSGSTAEDTFRFTATGMVSAVSSELWSGFPGDGQTRVEHTASFYNDLVPVSGPAATCSGVITLPAMRSLAVHELYMKLEVIRAPSSSPTVILTQSAGDPARTFALVPGTEYELKYEYEYRVPFGIDPAFDGGYELTISPAPSVPGLSNVMGAVLLLLALVGIGSFLWRQDNRSPFAG
jgi:hypothetical protein